MMRRPTFFFIVLYVACLGLSGCASVEHAMQCFPGRDSWPLCGL
jgi:uncharacterized protein YceK